MTRNFVFVVTGIVLTEGWPFLFERRQENCLKKTGGGKKVLVILGESCLYLRLVSKQHYVKHRDYTRITSSLMAENLEQIFSNDNSFKKKKNKYITS